MIIATPRSDTVSPSHARLSKSEGPKSKAKIPPIAFECGAPHTIDSEHRLEEGTGRGSMIEGYNRLYNGDGCQYQLTASVMRI